MDARPDRQGTRGPLQVLHLVKGLDRGGAETLVMLVAAGLDSSRFAAQVVFVRPDATGLLEDVTARGLQATCLATGLPLGWLRELRIVCRSGDVDVLHTHSPLTAALARLVVGRHVGAVVHTEHNVWPSYRMPTRIANALTFGANRLVIAVSDAVKSSVRKPVWAWWVKMPPVDMLHHGIDLTRFRPDRPERDRVRAELGLRPTDVVIGNVANFTAKKHHVGLLEAFGAMAAERSDVRLLLVGSGDLEEELHRETSRAPWGDQVSFLGARADVARLNQAFDIFCLSSLHEGLPLALLEAMASGVAPVVTDVGGISEVITDGVEGLIVPPGSVHKLTEALRRCVDDQQVRQRFGEAAAQRVQAFSIEGVIREHEARYDRLIEDRG